LAEGASEATFSFDVVADCACGRSELEDAWDAFDDDGNGELSRQAVL
jgi:hypothetical protein